MAASTDAVMADIGDDSATRQSTERATKPHYRLDGRWWHANGGDATGEQAV